MRLRRLIASMSAGFDGFVTRVENHAAVADCMIGDVRSAAARLKVQVAGVEAELARLEERRKELDAARSRWLERALRLSRIDELQAVECVSRLETTEGQLAQTRARATRYGELQDRLREALAQVERRLEDLRMRRVALDSRGTRADALAGTDTADVCADADQLFARWEASVVETEYRAGPLLACGDSLDRSLSEEERQTHLRQRLTLLLESSEREGAASREQAS